MKLLLITILLMLISCDDPTTELQKDSNLKEGKTYGFPMTDEVIRKIISTDSGYLLLGDADFSAITYLLKIDEYGDTLWTKTYNIGTYEYGKDIASIDDGYIITGRTFPNNNKEFFVMKIDTIGEVIWTKEYSGVLATQMCVTQNEIVITGFGNPSWEDEDFNVIKIDLEGNLIWHKTYNSPDKKSDISFSLTKDGHSLLLAGASSDKVSINKNIYLVKIDSNGDTLWSKSYSIGSSSTATSTLTTKDGYIIGGYFTQNNEDGIFIHKIDKEGNTLFIQTHLDTQSLLLNQIIENHKGYMLAGSIGSLSPQAHDVYIMQTDYEGNKLWSRTYGGTKDDRGRSIVKSNLDDGYIIAGTSDSFSKQWGDCYILKIDPNGTPLWFHE